MKKDVFSQSNRLAEISRSLRYTLYLWNYNELFLPAIEPFDEKLDKGTKFVKNDRFYLIQPDVTSQILKNLNNRNDLRLFYISEVLDGGVKGEWQCGIERIGGKNISMQIEVLMVLLTSLDILEIEDFYLDIGSLKVWEKATQDVEEYRSGILRGLHRRNFDFIEALPLEKAKKQKLWKLFNYRGKHTDYEKLEGIVEALDSERVFVDFGTVRPLPYYEDLVFEIYSPKYGQPIGRGGEYKFEGRKACGFAFDMRALAQIYDGRSSLGRTVLSRDTENCYKEAKRLVERGTPVEVEE